MMNSSLVTHFPDSVLAAGWIPFVVCMALSVLFSVVYSWWHRSGDVGCGMAMFITIFSLTASLLFSALVPVDVFLVSFMKNPDGSFKDWAADPQVRRELLGSVMQIYYAFYGIMLSLAFLVLPFTFFYYAIEAPPSTSPDEPTENTGNSLGRRLCRATQYTACSLVLLGLLILMGVFIPFDQSPPHEDTLQQQMAFMVQQLHDNEGHNLMVFLINVVNVVGMVLVVVYVGFGMTSLPLGFLYAGRTVHSERASVDTRITQLEQKVNDIRLRWMDQVIPQSDAKLIEDMEKQIRLLQRTRHDLEQRARGLGNRCVKFCRPLEITLGGFLAAIGLLIFLSLLLVNIDKAMHSKGPTSGYILPNATLPNPMDKILVWAQAVFPVDYIIYCSIILFLVCCALSGIKNVGIRFVWMSVYQIKAHATKPQGLTLLCLNLIFIQIALNVIMFSIVPQYTTYGFQHVLRNGTSERCLDIQTPQQDCIMTQIAVLLLAFHSKVWIFGAFAYWLTWLYLATVVTLALWLIIQCWRQGRISHPASMGEEPEDDEQQLLPSAAATVALDDITISDLHEDD